MCKETNTDAIFAAHRQRKNNPPMLLKHGGLLYEKRSIFLSLVYRISIYFIVMAFTVARRTDASRRAM